MKTQSQQNKLHFKTNKQIDTKILWTFTKPTKNSNKKIQATTIEMKKKKEINK